MRYTGSLKDVTASTPSGYARGPVAASFKPNPFPTPPTSPSQSDPSTGALTVSPITLTGSSRMKNFWFVVGMFLITLWLESA